MDIKLRNVRKSIKGVSGGPIVGTDPVERADGELVNRGGQTRYAVHGKVQSYPADNPAVKIYARAGYLEPVDKNGEDWLRRISK
jgi:hypothetical protein